MSVILIGAAKARPLGNDIHWSISAATNVMIFISGGATILEGFPNVIRVQLSQPITCTSRILKRD